MKWETKKLNDSELEVSFTIPAEKLEQVRHQVLLEFQKDFKKEGFRKGKAPLKVVAEQVGEQRILDQTVRTAAEQAVRKCVKEEQLQLVSQPKVEIPEILWGSPLEFKVVFSVLPEIELPDYQEIASQVEVEPESVQSQEIDQALERIRMSRAKLAQKQGPAREGDFVEIQYSSPAIKGGKEFKDGFILGKGFLVPGFGEQLQGMESGAEKNFSLEFPKNHPDPKLAGKELDFKVQMNSVKKVNAPELNDQFAQDLGKFEGLEGLKQNVKEGLSREKRMAATKKRKTKILDRIRKNTEIDLPQDLVEREREHLLEDLKNRVPEGQSIEDFLKRSEQEIKESLENTAKKRIKNSLIIKGIARKEGVSVTEQEIEQAANQRLKNYPGQQAEELDLKRFKAYTKGALIEQKVFQQLLS